MRSNFRPACFVVAWLIRAVMGDLQAKEEYAASSAVERRSRASAKLTSYSEKRSVGVVPRRWPSVHARFSLDSATSNGFVRCLERTLLENI